MINKLSAIQSLRPKVEWTMNGDDVKNIIWHTANVEPLTEAEVKTEITRLEKIQKDEETAKVANKKKALKKLAELGLTEEEVNAIL
jgi:hypothetical protein